MAGPQRIGEFDVREEIGRGGFGIVYRAMQTSLDRPVALKVLYRNLIHTDEQVGRFEREARAAARLDHPAIVQVYAWGEANDDFYIAQKLVGHGRTLGDELAGLREKDTPPTGYFRSVAKRLALVAEGLQQAHERGIVHRDVKPTNILLDDDGNPFLGDFGLAKVEDGLELSRTGDLAGSPFYMSPEQADSTRGQVEHYSDTYSLGVTLYECLTLTQPFRGTTSHEIVRKILTEEPRRPSKLQPRVPADLETICLKAMEKNRGARYASAAELAADLKAFLDGEPISAVPIGTTRRLMRKARRQRVPLAVGLVAIVLMLGGWQFAFYMLKEQDSEIAQKDTELAQKDASAAIGEKQVELEQALREELDPQIRDATAKGDTETALELMDQRDSRLAALQKEFGQLKQSVTDLGDSETARLVAKEIQSIDAGQALDAAESFLAGGAGVGSLFKGLGLGQSDKTAPEADVDPALVADAETAEEDAEEEGSSWFSILKRIGAGEETPVAEATTEPVAEDLIEAEPLVPASTEPTPAGGGPDAALETAPWLERDRAQLRTRALLVGGELVLVPAVVTTGVVLPPPEEPEGR